MLNMDALSNEQKDLLKRLGVIGEKVNTAPKVNKYDPKEDKGFCPGEPYYLKLTKKCQCCGHVEQLNGLMHQKKSHHSYLSFDQEVKEPETLVPVKNRFTTVLTCGNCQDRLMERSKEELIRQIMTLSEGVSQ